MVEYRSLFVRSVRRVRVEFSTALAAGAFSSSWFSLVCNDSTTGDPTVVAALPVPALGNYVELVADRDLPGDASYTLSIAAGVPATDATTAAAASQLFIIPAESRAPSKSVSANDIIDLIFQEDIAHDMVKGHQLAPDGDLASVSGPANVRANLKRGMVSQGLPHRVDWGAGLREDVDAPNVTLPAMRGKIEQQALRDDRITACRGDTQDLGGGDVLAIADVDLVGQLKTKIREQINASR